MKKAWNGKVIRGIAAAVCAVLVLIGYKDTCFADATGKIKVASAKIRKSADVSSEVIGSSAEGKTVTITGELTDASGTLWYEVYVDANTKGYIRSDLVDKDASSGTVVTLTSSSTNTDADNGSSSQPATASGAEIPAETAMDAQYASVKVPAAKIRSGASTTKAIVDTLSADTQVIVNGQTNGSDGKVWYYITFTGTNGVQSTGYVRNDLVNLGDLVPADEPEPEPAETPIDNEPAEPVAENNDYQLIYELNPGGEYEWYLYDNTGEERTKQKLGEVLAAAHAQSLNNELDAKTVSKQRIVIVILIAVITVLAVVMTIMLFKLRDAYYESYEDDDEEDEEEEERSRVKKREETVKKKSAVREVREERPQPVRKRPAERERAMPAREVTYEEEPVASVKTTAKRKAKNFLLDDDEFEFEFLNMKDKQ